MSVPTGIIAIWSGFIGDIPPGWGLCNGAAGTPNLQNRFVIGAGDSFNPDDTGGAATHTHTFTGDGHFHTIGVDDFVNAGLNFDTETNSQVAAGTTDAGSSMPTYYALAYIMKL